MEIEKKKPKGKLTKKNPGNGNIEGETTPGDTPETEEWQEMPDPFYYAKDKHKHKEKKLLIADVLKIDSFQNYFKDSKSCKKNKINKEEEDKIKSDYEKNFSSYDLIYCYKNKCEPNNLLCKDCMKINQRLHNLKDHYLINSAGRVCTYKNKMIYCLCLFEKKLEVKKDSIEFYPTFTCGRCAQCESCKLLQDKLQDYLSDKLYKALIERDEENGVL